MAGDEQRALRLLAERGGWDLSTATAVQAFLRVAGVGSWQLLRMIDSETVVRRWLAWLEPVGRPERLDLASLWAAVEHETLRLARARAESYAEAKAGHGVTEPFDREASAAAGTLRGLWLRLANLQDTVPATTACLVTAHSYESQANRFPEEGET